MKRLIAILTCASLSIMLMAGCQSSTQPTSGAPSMPSVESMTIPSLGESSGQAKTAPALAKKAGLNHGMAVLAVGFWTGATAVALAVPVALFKLAHSTPPVALPDSAGWKWEIANARHSATLTAEPRGDKIYWKMVVNAADGSLTDFTWYDGLASENGETGNWTFYHVEDRKEQITFDYELTTSTETLKAEVVDEDDVNKGNYLSWAADRHIHTFTAYDASNDQGKAEMVEIKWNSITEAGSIYNHLTGNRFCWGSKPTHPDITCDELVLE